MSKNLISRIMTDIINRVTESGLISLDLADYKPTQSILGIV